MDGTSVDCVSPENTACYKVKVGKIFIFDSEFAFALGYKILWTIATLWGKTALNTGGVFIIIKVEIFVSEFVTKFHLIIKF